ncbi:MAG TPA: 2-C-methyl-D-erythritol 4-phosphate cytidylyltransferase [Ktedonobacterales bacterium]|nr:2-C-methyl-D-erythritol 4-phosphate cytidylyltransferase [Ktedonobacterales bacterium]
MTPGATTSESDGRGARQGQTLAIVLCAGQGSRMGAAQNKIFLPLAGMPVGARAIGVFQDSPLVDEILVMAHPLEVQRVREELIAPYHFAKVSGVAAGGASRHQSEERALEVVRERIASGDIGLVMIHDGARPLVTGHEIARLVTAIRASPRPGGALLATRVAPDERIAQVGADGLLEHVFSAGELARAQTPQGFDALALLAAYDHARREGIEGTDTASVVEAAGGLVVVVAGDEANLKVTTPDDLLRAEAILRARGTSTTS